MWSTGNITCKSTEESKLVAKSRSSPIIKTLNLATGKESTKLTDFNQANWGKATTEFLRSAKENFKTDKKFQEIVDLTKVFSKHDQQTVGKATPPKEDQGRGPLLDDPDTDDSDDGDASGNGSGDD